MPLYILAGLIVLLNNTVFKWIFQGDTLTRFQYWGITIANGTLSISGMIIAVMVGYFLAKKQRFRKPVSSINAIISFFNCDDAKYSFCSS